MEPSFNVKLFSKKKCWKFFWVDNWHDLYTRPLYSATARLSLTATLNSTWRLKWLRSMDMDGSSVGSKDHPWKFNPTKIHSHNPCEWCSRPMFSFVWWSSAQKTQKVFVLPKQPYLPFTLPLISFHRLPVRDVGWVSIIHCLLIVLFKCQTVPHEGMQRY